MNFADIEKTINSLAKKANDGTISIDEMAGGSFTISNGGVYGSLLSTPIINPPQVGLCHNLLFGRYYFLLEQILKAAVLSLQSAILGMHTIVNRAMVVGKEILPRPMMYIALTYDHRLIDGREAVFFLKRIKIYDRRLQMPGLASLCWLLLSEINLFMMRSFAIFKLSQWSVWALAVLLS